MQRVWPLRFVRSLSTPSLVPSVRLLSFAYLSLSCPSWEPFNPSSLFFYPTISPLRVTCQLTVFRILTVQTLLD